MSLSGAQLFADPLFNPVSWNPSGSSVALILKTGDEAKIFPSEWVWGTPLASQPIASTAPPIAQQLWVQSHQGEGDLVEETTGELSSPAWSPAGDSLAFVCRSAGVEGSPVRTELVRRFPDGRREVIFHEETPIPPPGAGPLARAGISWSSDGRYLAFPWPSEPVLRVIDLETNQVVAGYEGGQLPSWSRTGRWLAYYRAGEGHGFRVVRTGQWESMTEKIAAPGDGPALWEPAEDSLYLIRPTEADPVDTNRPDFGLGRRQRQSHFAIVRVRPADFSPQVVAKFQRPTRAPEERMTISWDYCSLRDEAMIATAADDAVYRVELLSLTGSRTEGGRLSNLGSLIEAGPIPVGALAYSPKGDALAFRFGVADPFAPAAIRSADDDKLHILAPSAGSRRRALWTIAMLLARQVRPGAQETPIPFGIKASPVDPANYRKFTVGRSTPLDLFDLPHRQENRDASVRESIDRLCTTALEFLPESSESPPTDQTTAELRLALHYMKQDYAKALSDISDIRPAGDKPLDPVRDIALALIRIQCLVALHRKQAALWEWNKLARRLEEADAAPNGIFGPMDPQNVEAAKQLEEVVRRRMIKIDRILNGESPVEASEPNPSDDADRPAAEK